LNTDKKGMATDCGACFAKHSNHPGSSVGIRVTIFKPWTLDDECLSQLRRSVVAASEAVQTKE